VEPAEIIGFLFSRFYPVLLIFADFETFSHTDSHTEICLEMSILPHRMNRRFVLLGATDQEKVATWCEGWIKDFMMHHEITGMVCNSSARPIPLPFLSFLTEIQIRTYQFPSDQYRNAGQRTVIQNSLDRPLISLADA